MLFFQNAFKGQINLSILNQNVHESQQTQLSFMVLFFFKNVFNGKMILSDIHKLKYESRQIHNLLTNSGHGHWILVERAQLFNCLKYTDKSF